VNFSGRYDFVQRPGTIITGDRDKNGIKEIYIFTLSNDSVLLHCLADYKKAWVPVRNRFVTLVGKRNNKADPYILTAEMDDLTGDGSGELIFGVGTGYSLVREGFLPGISTVILSSLHPKAVILSVRLFRRILRRQPERDHPFWPCCLQCS